MMRKESKADSFQRQISALRQQLGGHEEDEPPFDDAEAMPDEAPAPPQSFSPSAPTATFTAAGVAHEWDAPDAAVSVVAANAHWDGKLRSDGSLHVRGRVEGEISAEHDIVVTDGASVNAVVRAVNVVVAGVVEGTIECTGRLEVLPSGRVSGDVTAPSLVVHDGATLSGSLRMQSPAGAGT